MAKNALTDYSTTAASNTDIGGTDIQGTASVLNFDNALRTFMSHLANTNAGTAPWADTMTIADPADLTKEARFDCGSITTATTRVYTLPDVDGTVLVSPITSTDAGATGPTIDIYHNSASPAASDEIGRIQFNGNDAGGNKTEYGRIRTFISDTTNGSEDGYLSFATMKAGTLAEILTLNPNAVTFTPSSTFSVINTNSDTNAFVFMGGNTGSTGGQFIAYGQSHATLPSDVAIFSGGAERYRYLSSSGIHRFASTTTVEVGTFSSTGATAGVEVDNGRLSVSTTGTGSVAQAAFYNANGEVGTIATNLSATAYNTSSDERLKQNFRAVDSGPIIDAIKIHKYDWKTGGSGIGPKAQELHQVFPDAVTPGKGNPGDKDFRPWGWDASKLVPVLVKEIQEMRKRLAALEA